MNERTKAEVVGAAEATQKRAAEEAKQAAQVRRLAEAAEEARRLQEARREVALAEGQERQAALQSHLTELAEAQRNLRIQAEAAVQEEYVASVSAREARDKEAEVVREEQTRKVAEGIAAEQEARRAEFLPRPGVLDGDGVGTCASAVCKAILGLT